jgi:hypothetical protein
MLCDELRVDWIVSAQFHLPQVTSPPYCDAIMSNSFGGDVIDMLDMDYVTQLMESMGIATNHKLVLKSIYAGLKKNPDAAFEALTAAKVAPAMSCVRVAFRHFNAGRCRQDSAGGGCCRPEEGVRRFPTCDASPIYHQHHHHHHQHHQHHHQPHHHESGREK